MNDPENRHFYLDVASTGLRCLAGLNDVPLITDLKAEGVMVGLPVNEWLMPGKNRLTAFVSWPPDHDYAPGVASIKVSVFLADPKEKFPRPLDVLASVSYPPSGLPEVYPVKLDIPFSIVPPLSAKLWSQAAVIPELFEADHVEIVALVEKLRNAMAKRDFDAAFRMVEYHYDDVSLANGIPSDRMRNAILKQYGEMMNEPGIASKPLTQSTAMFELVADKKLVRVAHLNYGDAIVFENDQDRYSIDIYVAKIDGRWTIVR